MILYVNGIFIERGLFGERGLSDSFNLMFAGGLLAIIFWVSGYDNLT